MVYSALADAMSALHLAFVLFVLIGQILIVVGALAGWRWVRNPWFRLAHFLAIGIVVFETLFDIECPLTKWERWLRAAAGQEDRDRDASFIGQMLRKVLFWNGMESVLNKIYIGFGLAVALTLVFCPPRLPWRRHRDQSTPQPPPSGDGNAVAMPR